MKWVNKKIFNIYWIVGIKNGINLYEIYYSTFNTRIIYLVRDGVELKYDFYDNLQTKIEEYKNFAKTFEREMILNKLLLNGMDSK